MLRDNPVLMTAWRASLVLASLGMVAGGLLHAAGQQQTSASVVTLSFAVSMLAVVVGLATRPEPTEEELCG